VKKHILFVIALLLIIPLVLAACDETDGGDEPTVPGSTSSEEQGDCDDSCTGDFLTECVCNESSGLWYTTSYDCTSETGYICHNGACVQCEPGDEQACETDSVGICSEAKQTCSDAGSWGTCGLTFSEMIAEDCDDSKDNDCDGLTDCDDCDCEDDEACEGETVGESDETETTTETGESDDDSEEDFVLKTLFPKSACGPKADDIFVEELNKLNALFKNYDSDWGFAPPYSTTKRVLFLDRHGTNIDFMPSPVKKGGYSCPTKDCYNYGWPSLELCGRCMPATTANNILYGYVAERIGLSETVAVAGAHAHNLLAHHEPDGPHALAAYKFGAVLEGMQSKGNLTTKDLCDAIGKKALLGDGWTWARYPVYKRYSDVMSIGDKNINCTLCPLGPATSTSRQFSKYYPWSKITAGDVWDELKPW